jgi:hypothetical protein
MKIKRIFKISFILGILVFVTSFQNVFASAALYWNFSPQTRFSYKAVSSLNWAGYVADSGKFTSVTGSWQIPKVKNSSNFKTDAAWVGIGGVTTADLIQAGTEADAGIGGAVSYSAWYELLPDYPQKIPVAVNSGDFVTVDISQIAQNKWNIHFRNNTIGQSFQKNVAYHSSLSSAEWIEEMPSLGNDTLIPLDNFREINFSNGFAVRNGKKVNIALSGAKKVFMSKADGKLLASVSTLNSQGTSFLVKRLLR